MKKRIIALLTCVMLIAALSIVPDVDAGKSTFNITNQTRTVAVGKSFTIKLNGIKAKKVKWSSSNTSVATVSKTGVVSGVKKGKATITGKYKGIKFKIKVIVYNKGSGEYSYKDMSFKYKESKLTKYDDVSCWAITFEYSNSSETGASFSSEYYPLVYVNNVERDMYDDEDYYTKVKDGASIEVTLYYKAKKGDKIDFDIHIYNEDDDKVIVFEKNETL